MLLLNIVWIFWYNKIYVEYIDYKFSGRNLLKIIWWKFFGYFVFILYVFKYVFIES